jgi:hypothetical protein
MYPQKLPTAEGFIETYFDKWTKQGLICNYDFKQQLDDFFILTPYDKPSAQTINKLIRDYSHKKGFSFRSDVSMRDPVYKNITKGKSFAPSKKLQDVIFHMELSKCYITIHDGIIIITKA